VNSAVSNPNFISFTTICKWTCRVPILAAYCMFLPLYFITGRSVTSCLAVGLHECCRYYLYQDYHVVFKGLLNKFLGYCRFVGGEDLIAFKKPTIRPMSHLQLCCATLSCNFTARQSCNVQLRIKPHEQTKQTWLLVTLMTILLRSVYSTE